jgi:hypothetical protein
MSRSRATYQEIRKWVLQNYGFEPETCWIANCKELHGLPLGAAHNRRGDERTKPCPPDKQLAITKAFKHFGLL